MRLTDNEKRDIVKLIEQGKNLPEKYRFLLFDKSQQVELSWNGKSNDIINIALPFQIIEQIDEPRNEKVKLAQGSFDFASGRQITGWTNKLIWGDNKFILSSLKNGPMRDEIEKQGGIKLIYIDPPFDVGADFSMNVEVGEDSYEKKPNVLEQIAYRDTWGLGQDSFLSMIYERLILMKDLLADDGSIYFHCDWRLNSSIRIILDEIFGIENFKNEIVWCYRGMPSKATKFFNKKDNILFYTKTKDYIFNVQYGKPSEGTEKLYENKKKLGYNFNKSKRMVTVFDEEKYKIAVEKGLIPSDLSPRFFDGIKPPLMDWWDDIPILGGAKNKERLGYPTQKPEKLIERIIKSSSNEEDLVCDFFGGSGTVAAVAEKNNRKWICSDLGKFSIHTIRKRMISTQRELKKEGKNWRAFEILNLGKYQREHFIYEGKNERDEIKKREKKKKEKDFEKLILEAFNASEVSGFSSIHGKKGDIFVSLGPVNQALSRNHVEEVITECIKNNITSVDILGFEYEMGLFPTIQEEAKSKGLRLTYKQIPMEVFDKRAVSKGEVIFHDVAYIEFKPIFKGKKLSIELTDFAVFYNEDNIGIDENLNMGKSKIVVENGQIIEKKKDNNGIIKEKIITKNWYDWIDYWSVDFDYESKPEIIKFKTPDGKIEEEWTGNYVFENEWQSFRQNIGNIKLELKSSEREILSKKTKVAVKVVDIFGNDTMKVVEVKI